MINHGGLIMHLIIILVEVRRPYIDFISLRKYFKKLQLQMIHNFHRHNQPLVQGQSNKSNHRTQPT